MLPSSRRVQLLRAFSLGSGDCSQVTKVVVIFLSKLLLCVGAYCCTMLLLRLDYCCTSYNGRDIKKERN